MAAMAAAAAPGTWSIGLVPSVAAATLVVRSCQGARLHSRSVSGRAEGWGGGSRLKSRTVELVEAVDLVELMVPATKPDGESNSTASSMILEAGHWSLAAC